MMFVSIACQWLLGEECSEDTYKRLEMIPEKLATLNDPLPKAIVAACIARRTHLESQPNSSPRKILQQCDYASHLLADSLTITSCKKRMIWFRYVKYFD